MQIKTFDTSELAQRAIEKLVAEKLRKGYRETPAP
jgi:predicted DNA-binding WGR domain protein